MNEDISKFLRIDQSSISRGWSIFDGHTAMQNEYAYSAIYNMIDDIQPDTIIEIGTAQCGLTRFLRRVCDSIVPETRVISYDIGRGPRKKDSITDNIEFRLENCFHNHGA